MNFEKYLKQVGEYGIVSESHYPLALVNGLPGAKSNEVVIFETGERGQVFLLEKEIAYVLLFSQDPPKTGTRVTRTDSFLSIPVGHELLGTTIDPLGSPLSFQKAHKRPEEESGVDKPPSGIGARARIKTPLETGVAVIDMMIPLGRGQKELIMGDRKTGKTSFVLSVLKNQAEKGTIAIYAAIGKKKGDIKRVQEFVKRNNIESKTIIVATSSYDSPSLIYITPYAAMTIAEYFRDRGENVLVVLDDLTSHGFFYREMSLLAKRFPGRDSYPGDIFYTHARLLERAGNFKHPKKGEVSITCLPIVEIVEGDLTGYISTNIMGITDGHIFFDSNVFNQGRRPAINIPLSVTRVGRQTQTPLVRDINRELFTFLGSLEKMQNLSHFGAELPQSGKDILEKGEMVYNFLNQSVDEVVPSNIQKVILGMVLLGLLGKDLGKLYIADYRRNLQKAYQNPNNRKIIEKAVAGQTLREMLDNIQKASAQLTSLCKTEAQ